MDEDDDDSVGFLFLLAVAGAIAVVIYNQQTIGDAVTAAVSGWQSVEQGPVWVPVINQAESAAGIPTNLLARMAYEESHFRPDVISGATASSAGALGILQLMPQYFQSVNVPIPYSAADTSAQISEAATQLASLYSQFGDWTVAVAAYNAGSGNMTKVLAGTMAMPAETQAYINDIFADVPVAGQLA
jgi:soluble lytic murein transglycosylase-like protein